MYTAPRSPAETLATNLPCTNLNYSRAKPDLLCGSNNNTVLLWSMGDKRQLFKMPAEHTDSISGLRFHPTDAPTLLSCSTDKQLVVWDIRASKVRALLYKLQCCVHVGLVLFLSTQGLYLSAFPAMRCA